MISLIIPSVWTLATGYRENDITIKWFECCGSLLIKTTRHHHDKKINVKNKREISNYHESHTPHKDLSDSVTLYLRSCSCKRFYYLVK